MGRTARQLYESNFTLDDTVQKTVQVYNEVVGAE
jgi:hypothetical protein